MELTPRQDVEHAVTVASASGAAAVEVSVLRNRDEIQLRVAPCMLDGASTTAAEPVLLDYCLRRHS